MLIEFVKYRDSVCEKFKKDNVTPPSGFKWPWQ